MKMNLNDIEFQNKTSFSTPQKSSILMKVLTNMRKAFHLQTSSLAAVTHIIHPEWRPRKLAVSMHSRFSHVMYNCLAVNRAPFRSWLYKIKRSKSKLCRYGCNCQEDFSHALFFCASVADERKALHLCCTTNDVPFDLKTIMTLPILQFAVERLLSSFFSLKA